jgi:hypothetical protein
MSQKDGSKKVVIPDHDQGVITWDKTGAGSFDLGAALKAYEENEAEAVAELNRLMGRRLPGDPSPTGRPPRARVYPPTKLGQGVPNVPGAPGGKPGQMDPSILAAGKVGKSGMGDIHDQTSDPGARYYENWPMERGGPIETPVAELREQIPEELKPLFFVLNRVFREHEARLPGIVHNVQPQTHLSPQPTAISVDLFTDASGVTLPGGLPGTPTAVLTLDVPDRFVVVLDRFGNQLEDHLAVPNVRFSMQRNRSPIRSYGNFNNQLGRFVDPTKLASPIVLKHTDEFRLYAQSTDGNDHTAFARLMGWAFAVKSISSEGSFSELLSR